MFNCSSVWELWIVHELANSVDREGEFRTSECNVLKSANNLAVESRIYNRDRSISNETKGGDDGCRLRFGVEHVDTLKKIVNIFML